MKIHKRIVEIATALRQHRKTMVMDKASPLDADAPRLSKPSFPVGGLRKAFRPTRSERPASNM